MRVKAMLTGLVTCLLLTASPSPAKAHLRDATYTGGFFEVYLTAQIANLGTNLNENEVRQFQSNHLAELHNFDAWGASVSGAWGWGIEDGDEVASEGV